MNTIMFTLKNQSYIMNFHKTRLNEKLIKKTKMNSFFKPIFLNKKYYFFLFLKTSLKPIKSIYKVHPSVKQFFLSYEKLTTNVYSITYLYSK